MVATGDQRRACRRAERGGVELSVTQACLGDTIQSGSRDDAAECARNTVALVIGHDEKNVGRAFGRDDSRRPKRLGVQSTFLDHTSELFGRCWELFAIDGYRGAGVTRRAVDLLSGRGRRDRHYDSSDHRAYEDILIDFHRRLTELNFQKLTVVLICGGAGSSFSLGYFCVHARFSSRDSRTRRSIRLLDLGRTEIARGGSRVFRLSYAVRLREVCVTNRNYFYSLALLSRCASSSLLMSCSRMPAAVGTARG